MESITAKVLRAIQKKGRGSVFTPNEFLNTWSRSAVDQALSRLARSGEIRRLGRGIYDYPQTSPRLGVLTPPPEAIAQALARQEGVHLQASGARAANALGLTTQVPGRLTFLTDGTPRSRRIGRQVIELKRAAPKKLRGAGTVAGTVLQAIRYLGPEGLTNETVQQLSRILSPRDKRELRSVISAAPGWARPTIERVARSETVAPQSTATTARKGRPNG